MHLTRLAALTVTFITTALAPAQTVLDKTEVAEFRAANHTDETVRAKLAEALKQQRDKTRPVDPELMRFVELARLAGRCPDEAWATYVQQGLTPKIGTDATLGRVRDLHLNFGLSPTRLDDFANGWVATRLTSLTMDGRPATEVMKHAYRAVSNVRGGAGGGLNFSSDYLPSRAPGPHRMKAVWTVEVLPGMYKNHEDAERVAAIKSFEVAHEWTLTIAPVLARTVTLVKDPALKPKIDSTVSVKSAQLSNGTANGVPTPFVLVELAHKDTPVQLCFALEVRAGDRSFRMQPAYTQTRRSFPGVHQMLIPVPDANLKPGDQVSIALVPDPAGADYSPAIDIMWSEEVVIPNVTLVAAPAPRGQ
jgi:hypothetical protein